MTCEDTKVGLVSIGYGDTGVGKYSHRIHEELQQQLGVAKMEVDFENRLLKTHQDGGQIVHHRGRHLPIDHPGFFMIRSRSALPDGFDIYHGTHPSIGVYEAEPLVLTCHDLIKLRRPRGPLDKLIGRVEVHLLERADHVITDSEFSKADITAETNLDASQVTTVYPGVDDRYRPVEIEKREVRDSFGLPRSDPMVLYLGSEVPRKNVPVVIRACRAVRNRGVPVHFVKAGSAGTGDRIETESAVSEADMEDHTTFVGQVPESRLPHLYNAADVFVFPSEYEGFGLPPLEAMACGTPVITSNRSSLPEVVGDAAFSTDPHDVDQIAEHMCDILRDDGLKQQLAASGVRRASRFTWKSTVESLLSVYRQVMNQQ